MGLFDWVRQKAAGIDLIGYQSAPSSENYWEYAHEAYLKNPYAHAAIKLTARAIAQIPARLYRIAESDEVEKALTKAPRLHGKTKGEEKRAAVQRIWEERIKKYREHTEVKAVAKHYAKKELINQDIIEPVDNHEVYRLLREPNEYTQRSYQDLMVALTSYLEIGGMTLMEPVRGASSTDTVISSLRVHQPRDLRIDRQGGRPIGTITVSDESGDNMEFAYHPDPSETEVFYERYFHPMYPRFGLSPVEPAAHSVDINNQAREWNLNLLFNGAQPSGILSTDKQLGDSRRQKLKRQWREKHAGPQNAGSIVVADGGGGADFKATSMSPEDMQWGDLTRLSAKEVAVVWNVPAQLIGHTESQSYNNYRSARRSFYVEKVIPLTTKLFGFLNSTVIENYDEDLLLDYETASIDALKKEINEMHERAREDVQNTLLTPNEARAKIGEQAVEGGNVLLMPKNMIPLSAAPENPDDVEGSALEPMEIEGEPKSKTGFNFDPVKEMPIFQNGEDDDA